MAQDILITPGSGEPQILFRGSGTTDTAVELNVLSSYQSATGSGTALLYEGTEGLLFGVTDNLSSGTIFSVSDISGLPTIEVDASGDVKLGEYGRYVGVGTGVPAYGFDVSSSGRFEKGFVLSDYVPAVTTNTLYNDGGTLKFNGSAVGGGGGVDTYTSGVAAYSSGVLTAGPSSGIPFYGDAAQHGAITTSDNLVYNSGNQQLSVFTGGTPDGAGLVMGDNYSIQAGNVRLLFKAGGSNFAAAILNDGVNGRISVPANSYYSWSDDSSSPHSSASLKLYRDAAHTLAQRFDANAQEFRVYNTYTDSSNYERLSFKWDSNEAIIQTQAGGTGTQRSLIFDAASATNIPITARGAVSQSANLQEWQDSAGSVAASVDPSGSFEGYKGNFSGIVDVKFADSYYTTRISAGWVKLGANTNLSSNVAYLSWDPGSKIASLSHLGGDGLARLAGSSSANAANISTYGESHSSYPSHIRFTGVGGSETFKIDNAGNTTIASGLTVGGDADISGSLVASGVSVSGVFLADHVPASTTNRLYNDGGTLKFNGSAVGGGGSSLTAGSGVIVDGADRINIHGGTGNFQEIQLTSDNIFTPQMVFTASGVADTPVKLKVLSNQPTPSSSGTALSFEGKEGQLFGITDNLSSGTIFSVNDITGLPLISADASGDVKLGEYGRYVGVGTGVPLYDFDVSSSGQFQKGIILSDYLPATTTNAIYNDGGVLKFNGFVVSSDSVPASDTPTTEDATITLDLSTGNYHNVVLGNNVTKFEFLNAKRGQRFLLRITQHAASAKTIAWTNVDYTSGGAAATVRWAGGGTAPTMSTSTSHTDVYGFLCTNNAGSAFDGFVVGQDLPD